MEDILNAYYSDNGQKLHMVVDNILRKFYEISDKDKDDFYSLANEVFVDAMRRYDNSRDFDGFLYSCLNNKIKSEITKMHREKRKADRLSVSLDMPVGEDESITIGDTIVGAFDIDREVFGEKEEGYGKRMLLYLSKLSALQKEILRLHAAGYQPHEIREELQISEKQYADSYAAIHSYRNVSALFY